MSSYLLWRFPDSADSSGARGWCTICTCATLTGPARILSTLLTTTAYADGPGRRLPATRPCTDWPARRRRRRLRGERAGLRRARPTRHVRARRRARGGGSEEWCDHHDGGRASSRDLAWDGVGAAAGVTVAWLIDRAWHWHRVETHSRSPRTAFLRHADARLHSRHPTGLVSSLVSVAHVQTFFRAHRLLEGGGTDAVGTGHRRGHRRWESYASKPANSGSAADGTPGTGSPG